MPFFTSDEKIILEKSARYEGGGGIKIPGRKKGTLYLTNKRIIFEYYEGLISKKTFTPLDESISKISNVVGEGTISKKLVVEFTSSNQQKGYGQSGRVKFSTDDVSEWVREVKMAISDI